MEKFTKAPWMIEVYSDKSQIHVYSSNYDYTLHHHKKFFGLSLTDTDLANANLIAAAPEMYDALKRTKEMLENLIEYSGVNAIYLIAISEEIDSTEELLAKARGEK